MSRTETVVAGTLHADGTLVLDQRPDLPPGRVSIRLQPLPALPEGDPFFEMLKGIWLARAQAGHVPRSAEEIDAQVRQLRDASEEEINSLPNAISR